MRPSKAARRWSLFAGFVAGEAYSICATYFAHALAPASVYVVDRYTHQRLLPGQIGDVEEIFNWDGLLPILLVSYIVFSLPWCIIRVSASCVRPFGRKTLNRAEEILTCAPARAIAGTQAANWKPAAMTMIAGMLLVASFLLGGCSVA